MAVEIEKRYLVNKEKIKDILGKYSSENISQGYFLESDSEFKTVRVRTKGDKAFLTLKAGEEVFKRKEFEYKIPFEDAIDILNLSTNKIQKERFEVNYENNIWEIDVFTGDNDGLIIAEIELNDENQVFAIPDWITEDITEDTRYLNVNLSKKPFKQW